eukprot:4191180-Prymnesium_polylepis.1
MPQPQPTTHCSAVASVEARMQQGEELQALEQARQQSRYGQQLKCLADRQPCRGNAAGAVPGPA